MRITSKLRNIILTVVGKASLVSREFGHWYKKGTMHAKHTVALGLGMIFRCSDRELPEELEGRELLQNLGYSCPLNSSIFSKIRREVGEEMIGKVAELIIQELYNDRIVSLIAIDSIYMPYYYYKDEDAAWVMRLRRKRTGVFERKDKERLEKGDTNCM